MKTCFDCVHFLSTKSEANPADQGLCRRYPPRLFVTSADGERLHTGFPQVPGDWWCGEHKSGSFAAKRRRNASEMARLHEPGQANGSYDGEKTA